MARHGKAPKRNIDPNLLCGISDIAAMLNVSRMAVSNWRQRHEDFPAPLAELSSGPVFYWPDVQSWLNATGRI